MTLTTTPARLLIADNMNCMYVCFLDKLNYNNLCLLELCNIKYMKFS
jgi:hypothetical protein